MRTAKSCVILLYMTNQVPPPPFSFKKEQAATDAEFISLVAEGISTVREQYISSENMLGYKHGGSWQTNYPHALDNKGEMKKFSTSTSIGYSDIVDHDISKLKISIENIVKSMGDQLIGSVFSLVSETSDRSGNVVSAKDHASMAESFLASLEKIELSVDQNGEIQLPTFYVAPSVGDKIVAELKDAGPEFEARVEAVKELKTKKAIQYEADRKSKFLQREYES